ncbi:MAG: YbaN family protein [Acidimicrobiia bacterium]
MSEPIGPVRRLAYVSAGLVCVGLGGLGLVVPGLPATIFFIGAAACFSRSHPRLEQWVLGLPKVGPTVRDYRAGLGMPRRAKQWAIGSIVAFSTLSIVLLDAWPGRVAIGAVAAIGVWYVGWRVPTAPATGR